jgi:hypothetical protein
MSFRRVRSSSSETADAAQTDAEDACITAVEEMSVFSRPRTEADVLPGGLGVPYRMHCTEWHRDHGGCAGDGLGDESRLLLSGLGVRDVSLYAWPTTNGWVCWARVGEGGGGGCIRAFADARGTRIGFGGIDPHQPGSGYPGTLIGLLPDDVVAAPVQVDGVVQAAIVESNAIFYELPDSSCTNWAFESLTATYSDGRQDTVPISWHASQGNTPVPCPG